MSMLCCSNTRGLRSSCASQSLPRHTTTSGSCGWAWLCLMLIGRPWSVCARLLDRSGLACTSDFPGVCWQLSFSSTRRRSSDLEKAKTNHPGVLPSGSSTPDLSQQLVADHCRCSEIIYFEFPVVCDTWKQFAQCLGENGKPHWPQKRGRGRVMTATSVFACRWEAALAAERGGAHRRGGPGSLVDGKSWQGIGESFRTDHHTDHQPHPPSINRPL